MPSIIPRAARVWFLVAGAGFATFAPTPQLAAMPAPETFMVPMRDGVRLATDVYKRPPFDANPTILVRTPYDRTTDPGAIDPDWLERLHYEEYVYVVQDVRGRFGSEGDAPLFSTDGWGELQDGYDTIEWLADQSWCDGEIGMYGESARGMLQYLAAGAAPPSLRTCVSRIACEDFYQKAFFQGGGFRESLVNGWFNSVDQDEDIAHYTAHPMRGSFWDEFDLYERLSSVQVPILHIGGHYDVFGDSAIDAFRALQENGGSGAAGNQRLIMGPWGHRNINQTGQGELNYESGTLPLEELTIRWFDYWLKGIDDGVSTDPDVRYYLMGSPESSEANRWVIDSDFGSTAFDVDVFLHGPSSPDGVSLQLHPSVVADDSHTYTTDPDSPRPTLGGRNLFLDEGPYDQRSVYEGRSDGVYIETDLLSSPITVVGGVHARLYASSTTPDADFCVTLMDAYPDGRRMYITDGILRARHRDGFDSESLMTPGTVYPLDIDLWSTAYQFDAGHRIAIAISHNNYRRFAVNGNDGGPFGSGAPGVPADITLHASATYPSALTLRMATPDLVEVDPLARPALFIPPPVNPSSRFSLTVDGLGDRTGLAHIIDAGGRVVRTFQVGRNGERGGVTWDGTTESGRPAASGVYAFVVSSSGGQVAKRKLVLVR